MWRGVHPNGQRATWTQGRGTSGGVRAWGCFISIEAFMVSSFLTCIFCECWSIRSAVALLLTRMWCVDVGMGIDEYRLLLVFAGLASAIFAGKRRGPQQSLGHPKLVTIVVGETYPVSLVSGETSLARNRLELLRPGPS